jgi:asparagine synthase (glutamine-hydrolysing)
VLEEAVAKWMIADVEVGALLSGGFEASIIAAIALPVRAETGKNRLRSFSVGSEGSADPGIDRAGGDLIPSRNRIDPSRQFAPRLHLTRLPLIPIG